MQSENAAATRSQRARAGWQKGSRWGGRTARSSAGNLLQPRLWLLLGVRSKLSYWLDSHEVIEDSRKPEKHKPRAMQDVCSLLGSTLYEPLQPTCVLLILHHEGG